MFIRADKKTLLEAIAPCMCAVATKSANNTLSCLYFKAEEGEKLAVTSFDTSKGVKTRLDAFVLEQGSLLLDAVRFHSIVRSLPDGEISISSDENFVTTISSGSAKFEILGLSADSFPAIPQLSGESKFVIRQGVLKKMLQQVLFAASVIDLKPILTGVLFEMKGDSLRLCACDGYRIAIRDEVCAGGLDTDVNFVVPAKTLQELIKLLSDDEEDQVKIELARRHLIFAFDDFTFFSRYVDGEYIDYKRSLTNEFKTVITLGLSDAIGCLERCSLLIDERAKAPVRLSIEAGAISVKCATANGKIDEVFPCETEGEQMVIGFNNKFLLDALRAAHLCGDDEVVMEVTSPLSGMAIRPAEHTRYYYMVVPMRLN